MTLPKRHLDAIGALAGSESPSIHTPKAMADSVETPDITPPNDVSHAIAAVAGLQESDPSIVGLTAIQTAAGPVSYHDIILLADILDDFMRVRIANQNRLRSLTSTEDWGKGVKAPDYIANLIGHLEALEHGAELNLIRAVRRSPLGAWVKATPGVGEKGIGRLLKEIGDPAWNFKESRPRTLRELYAYCGLHVWPAHNDIGSQVNYGGPGTDPQSIYEDQRTFGVGAISERGDAHNISEGLAPAGVAPHRVKGQQSNWSTAAKTRLYTTAEACMKHRGSTYRPLYESARAKYAEVTHQTECKRCGPAGKPALIGSSLSAGHQHARALRLVMKAILKDLWLTSRVANPKETA